MRRLETLLRPLAAFMRLEAGSGILLLLCALAALAWANFHPASYDATFNHPLLQAANGAATFTPRAIINNGLMTLFFLVVGLEIKRELVAGELDSLAKASLPAIAALGGMIAPATIFLAWNEGTPGQPGWGIPIATDIAFCTGILTLLRDRVPRALVVFVMALAIFDDIGGIFVIAFFYGHGVNMWGVLGAAAALLGLVGINRAGVKSGLAYAVGGILLWYALAGSGIHPTLAGALLAFTVPARDAPGKSPAQHFAHTLHPLAAFAVMPLFALANSGVSLRGLGISGLASPVALGTAVGLAAGKLIGIFGATVLAVKLRVSRMPGDASFAKLLGVSLLAGVGFTVALFIAALAYHDAPDLLAQAKAGILLGSFAAGSAGYLVLSATGTGAPTR